MEDDEEEEKQEIWSWGAGTDGQLGTGKLQDEYSPQPLHPPPLSSAGPISMLACGGAHVIALTSGAVTTHLSCSVLLSFGFLGNCLYVFFTYHFAGGKVLTWGRGTSGQLGHGGTVNSPHPKAVIFSESCSITHVSAGWNHSGFVSGCLV